MIMIYGLKNCDSCRKAIRWFEAEGNAFSFIDLRGGDVGLREIGGWLNALGPEQLINRRGTTWRGLSDQEKSLMDHDALTDLIDANRALIKRPLIVRGDHISVGFTDEVKQLLTQ